MKVFSSSTRGGTIHHHDESNWICCFFLIEWREEEEEGEKNISCEKEMDRLISLRHEKGSFAWQQRERERENLSPSSSSSSSFLFDGEYFTLIVCVYMYLWVEHTQNIRSNICLSSAILFGCRRRRKFFFFASFFFSPR